MGCHGVKESAADGIGHSLFRQIVESDHELICEVGRTLAIYRSGTATP